MIGDLNAGDAEVNVKVRAEALAEDPVPVGEIVMMEVHEGEEVCGRVGLGGFPGEIAQEFADRDGDEQGIFG